MSAQSAKLIAPYANRITLDAVRRAYTANQYTYYEKGNFNVNIFAIRTDECTANTFNDVIGLTYKDQDVWQLHTFNATVDAGLCSRTNPVNSRGCAIIVPGQYVGCWQLGKHKGKYPALVQRKPIKLYRDNNRDEVLDHVENTIHEELAGINIHHAGTDSKLVDNWSAGCMVIANLEDWNEFYTIITQSAKLYGSIFTATIFTESQFFS